MRIFFIFILFVLASSLLSAQSHEIIPLSQEGLYDFLDMAEIRNLLTALPKVRPYTRSRIANALRSIEEHRYQLNPEEQKILDDYINRFAVNPDEPFSQDGEIRIKSDIFPTTIGGYLNGKVGIQFQDIRNNILGKGVAGFYIRGDIGSYVTWGVDLEAGFYLVDNFNPLDDYGPGTAEPYKYTKDWDGAVHPLTSLSSFRQLPLEISGGYAFYPQIVGSFWDNRVELQIGRFRRDWGLSEGNLFLDAQARPFLGFGGVIAPWKYVSLSFLTGILEYGEHYRNASQYSIRNTAREQQNMFSILQIEINPFNWLSLSFYDIAVYLKRAELGYIIPIMGRFLNQNNIGDFDNLALGGSLSFTFPGYFRAYFSAFVDESRFNQPDFFHNPANQYSFQAGIKIHFPWLPWTYITLQYTKIEPFTYTHYYLRDSPWLTPSDSNADGHPDYALNTGYLNGGENIGYALEPNSDELLFQIKSQVIRGVDWFFRYRMVRHGYAGPGGPPGSTFDAWGFDPNNSDLNENNDPKGAYSDTLRKDFLKDGVYEWFHIFTLGSGLDTRIWNEAVQFRLDYSFIFKMFTDYSSGTGFSPINSGDLKNQFNNVLSLSVMVSPY